MSVWLNAIDYFQRQQQACVLVTIIQTQGSTPRETGSKMVVSESQTVGTIGGGTLEQQAITEARHYLAQPQLNPASGWCNEWILGPDLGQCCGGVVKVFYEYIPVSASTQTWLNLVRNSLQATQACRIVTRINSLTHQLLDKQVHPLALPSASSVQLHSVAEQITIEEIIQPYAFTLVLFGAGHVGRALVQVMRQYPCRIIWLDTRADPFPPTTDVFSSAEIQQRVESDPASIVAQMPAGCDYLVMTHDHALDLAICAAILARDAVHSVGVIGSATKAARFRHRLRDQGFTPAQLQRLTCPIGLPDITSKHPGAIAIAVAAQLLSRRTATDLAPVLPSSLLTECRA